MGWLKKLPRFIRPPKAVRNTLEKIKGKDFLPGLIPPQLAPIATAIKNTASQSGGIVQQAGGLIQDARGAAQSIKSQEDQFKKLSTVLIIGVIIVVAWLLIKKR